MNGKGLLLFDAPTGFGKTEAIKEFIKKQLNKNEFNQIYVVTNLKTNFLKIKDEETSLLENVFFLKPYHEFVLEAWDKVSVNDLSVTSSKQFINLKKDIKLYNSVQDNEIKDKLKQIISTESEPEFRQYIKETYFIGKSNEEKNSYINENEWLISLYPSIELEKKKIVILTTSKFFSEIDTFIRPAFYMYNSDFLSGSLVFIDEIDATKETLLRMIVEKDIRKHVDSIKLFISIHLNIKTIQLPEMAFKISKGIGNLQMKIEDIIERNKTVFEEIFDRFKMTNLFKTKNINDKHLFIFYDNFTRLTISRDRDARYGLNIIYNESEKINEVLLDKSDYNLTVHDLTREVNYAINHFINGISIIAKNYMYLKNEISAVPSDKYSIENAVRTILTGFNIPKEYNDYLLDRVIYHSMNKSVDLSANKFVEFIHIQDSPSHDYNSNFHTYAYRVFPEDLLAAISLRGKIIGVSATATLETVVGNYVISDLKKILKEDFLEIDIDDFVSLSNAIRIHEIDKISHSNVDVHVIESDNQRTPFLDDKVTILIKSLVSDDYYESILVKIAYAYSKFLNDEQITSFLCLLNFIPSNTSAIRYNHLEETFNFINKINNVTNSRFYILNSRNYLQMLEEIHSSINQRIKVFVISCYQTMSTGKNIQFSIPDYYEDDTFKINEELERTDIDFNGIYLTEPTNLYTIPKRDDENVELKLSFFLVQQYYLFKASRLERTKYNKNIRDVFSYLYYNNSKIPTKYNLDLKYRYAQIFIQSIGRITRSPNANKKITVLVDSKMIEVVIELKNTLSKRLLNDTFRKVLLKDYSFPYIDPRPYSDQNIRSKQIIKNMIYRYRSDPSTIVDWKSLREYLLRYPTTDNPDDKYKEMYLSFEKPVNKYSFEYNFYLGYINEISPRIIHSYSVSENYSRINEIVKNESVAKYLDFCNIPYKYQEKNYIMTPAAYLQIYLGALGELLGKYIVETYCNIKLTEVGKDDISLFELFDYQYNDVYFDFKYWLNYEVDNEEYVEKALKKLDKVKGKCVIFVNILKRGEDIVNLNKTDQIIQIPYLIGNNSRVSESMIMKIKEAISRNAFNI